MHLLESGMIKTVNIRKLIDHEVFDYQTLVGLLNEYSSPRDKKYLYSQVLSFQPVFNYQLRNTRKFFYIAGNENKA